MKIVLVVLILATFIHGTSSILWRNRQTNAQRSTVLQQNKQLQNGTQLLRQPVIAANKSNTNKSPLQRVVNGQRVLIRNATAAQRQADSIRKNNTQVIPQNRFQAIANQQQQRNRALNNTNKQPVNPKFRYIPPKNKTNATAINAANRRAFLAALYSQSDIAPSKVNGSSIAKNKAQQVSHRLSPGKVVVNNTKSGLLRALASKPANNNGTVPRQPSLADYYYQAKLRALHQEINGVNAPQNRALKKRWAKSDAAQANQEYPMILARDESSDIKE